MGERSHDRPPRAMPAAAVPPPRHHRRVPRAAGRRPPGTDRRPPIDRRPAHAGRAGAPSRDHGRPDARQIGRVAGRRRPRAGRRAGHRGGRPPDARGRRAGPPDPRPPGRAARIREPTRPSTPGYAAAVGESLDQAVSRSGRGGRASSGPKVAARVAVQRADAGRVVGMVLASPTVAPIARPFPRLLLSTSATSPTRDKGVKAAALRSNLSVRHAERGSPPVTHRRPAESGRTELGRIVV